MEDDPFGEGDNTQMESTNQDDFFGGKSEISLFFEIFNVYRMWWA